jgi:hypothetical protein
VRSRICVQLPRFSACGGDAKAMALRFAARCFASDQTYDEATRNRDERKGAMLRVPISMRGAVWLSWSV